MFPREVDLQPSADVEQLGTVFARFDATTQDSGNVAYGVQTANARYFVKTAGPTPYLDFNDRMGLLRNAAELARSVEHPALPRFHDVIESPGGPLLVYAWRDGEHLGTDRDAPASAHQRFRALPQAEILAALDSLYDLHARLDAAGWVEGDFYDGALLYDFAKRQLTVIDLDTYHRGAYRNTMGRMFGSTRFMAPEQHSLGAPIDTRTTAYVLARTALVLLPDPPPALQTVLREATTTRYPSFAAFHAAWETAPVPTDG